MSNGALAANPSFKVLCAMSGRLTILPKKTYCPWKPENVERVLRDERLERERLEREGARSRADDDDRGRRRRPREDDDGHINLFPEARDAELNLARGGGRVVPAPSSSSSSSSSSSGGGVGLGTNDAPLGGDEAARRKSGAVPFYMRAGNGVRAKKYDDPGGYSFRLGGGGRGGGAVVAVADDEITGRITKDQFARREDGRKGRMDPMSSFVKSCPPSGDGDDVGVAGGDGGVVARYTRRRDDDDDGGGDADEDRSRSGRRPREGGGGEESSRRSAELERRSRPSDERRGRTTTTSRGKRSRDSDDRRGCRRRHRRSPPSRDGDADHDEGDASNNDGGRSRRSNNDADDMEELRKRRRAREAREVERERRVIFPPPGAGNAIVRGSSGREGKYQDQFNPTLSRN